MVLSPETVTTALPSQRVPAVPTAVKGMQTVYRVRYEPVRYAAVSRSSWEKLA